jgi:Fe-S-cluster-containing hydrogenase component 2
MGNRIYGCDDCLAVCPWNKFAVARERSGISRSGRAPRLGRAGGAGRCGVPRAVSRQPDQADRARPVRAQRALCDRKLKPRTQETSARLTAYTRIERDDAGARPQTLELQRRAKAERDNGRRAQEFVRIERGDTA